MEKCTESQNLIVRRKSMRHLVQTPNINSFVHNPCSWTTDIHVHASSNKFSHFAKTGPSVIFQSWEILSSFGFSEIYKSYYPAIPSGESF